MKKEYVPGVSFKAKRKATNSATNLLDDGDFSSGTISEWGGQGSIRSYENGQIKSVGNGTMPYISVSKAITGGMIKDHKYYIRFKATVDSNTKYLRTYNGVSVENLFVNPTGTNTVSKIVTCLDVAPFLFIYAYYADNSAQNGKTLFVDDILVIDLTATYGAGNEPTKEFMDATPYILTTGELPASTKSLSVYAPIKVSNFDFTNDKSIASVKFKSKAIPGNKVGLDVVVATSSGNARYYGEKLEVTGEYQTISVVIPKQENKVSSIMFSLAGSGDFTTDWTEIGELMISPGTKLLDYVKSEAETNGYFKASVISALEVEDNIGLDKFKVDFLINPPFLYLDSGLTPVTVTSGAKINNPGTYKSEPIIHIIGSGNITLTVNGKTSTITGLVSEIFINTELQHCYNGTADLDGLYKGDYPELVPGDNTISWSGGTITKVEIIPNWRNL